MAISWITALKLVPWAEVVKNAPMVADGAQKLWRAVAKKDVPEAEYEIEPAPDDATDASAITLLESRVASLEGRVSELQQEMVSSAGLITALAEQNNQLVQAMALMRVRTRLLLAAVAVLGAAAVACFYLLLAR